MKLRVLLAILIIWYSGVAQAHHKYGHQNTEPIIDMHSWDCGNLNGFIEARMALIQTMLKLGLPVPVQYGAELGLAVRIYEHVCREV